MKKKININTSYKVQLDHIRAAAAFMVFVWHFIHFNNFHLETPKIFLFPISLLTEGHMGVSIFMTLSGYLFAKILIGKKIIYKYFYLNRIFRLLPLICVVMLVHLALENDLSLAKYIKTIVMGFINKWPHGGWSLTVEFQFYYLLPFILLFLKKTKNYFFIIFLFTIGLKLFIYLLDGTVQHYAYFKIIGHIDEFLIGILSYKYRNFIKDRKSLVLIFLISYLIFYYYFEYNGGFYNYSPELKNSFYYSTSIIWVFIPIIQGLTFGLFISFYDNNNFNFLNNKLSIFISKIGLFSYSIYLWHFVYVFQMPKLVDNYLIKLDNLYITILLAIPCFMLAVLNGWISYNVIEKPFLKLRKRYVY